MIASSVQTLVLLAALATVACSTPRPAGPPVAPPIEGYVVGAPDMLQVHILPDPEILRDVRVRPDGKISIDLIGDVQAGGRTPFEIAQTIQQEIGRFKRDASVNVSVVNSTSRFVTILGEVGGPGTFALESETRVSEAIGRVGGPRPFASLNGVRIIRPRVGGAQILAVHLGDIQKGDLSTNHVIQEGDLIMVPPTVLARIGYAMQMLLFPFQPLIGAASSVGNVYSGYDAVR
jgi:polysaccharide biosynthesis/export protein